MIQNTLRLRWTVWIHWNAILIFKGARRVLEANLLYLWVRGKLLLYIDDILITTIILTENLNIIEKLLVLKKYDLELNLTKCLFLKREIEYPGYIVSANGIILNKRHIQTILNYSYPRQKATTEFSGFNQLFPKIHTRLWDKSMTFATLYEKRK